MRKSIWLITSVFNFVALSGVAFCATNPTVDFASAINWDNYDITLYRVRAIDGTNGKVTFECLQQFTTPPLDKRKEVLPTRLCDEKGKRPVLKVDDSVLLIVRKNDMDPLILAETANLPIEKDPNLSALAEISDLRKTNGIKSLEKGLDAKTELAVKYSQKTLLDDKDYVPPQAILVKLQKIRGDSARPSDSRLLANLLVYRSSQSDAQEWGEGFIKNEKNASSLDLTFVSNQLGELLTDRAQRLEFFTASVDDKNIPAANRLACMAALAQFCFDQKDPTSAESSKAFSSLIHVLDSTEPLLRKNTLGYLYYICSRVQDASLRQKLADRAIKAADPVIAREQDVDVQWTMSGFRGLLSDLK